VTVLLSLLVLCVAAGLGAVVVHEVGHAIAALLVGARGVRLRRDGFELAVHAELSGASWRRLCFYVGGMAANMVVAGAGWVVGGAEGWALAGMNLLFALVQLRGAGSDGAQLLAVWRGSRVSRCGDDASCAR
jgi:hypothetical protein